MVMLVEKVKETIAKYGMLQRGDGVLVALSGGLDSVALLSLLLEIRDEYELRIFAAHLNHRLRGEESEGDARWVERLCKGLYIPCRIGQEEVRSFCRERRIGLEEGARALRYRFLQRAASDFGAERIATGHTQDDQAETVLMRLLRGAGPTGLCGIRPIRGQIIRPLIEVRRGDLRNWLKERGGSFREDSSNRDLRYMRNRIRWRLLPQLNAYNPRITEALARSGMILWEQAEYLLKLAKGILEKVAHRGWGGEIILDLESLFVYDMVIRQVVLKEAFRLLGKGELPFPHLERLARSPFKGRISLPGGVEAEGKEGKLFLFQGTLRRSPVDVEVPGMVETQDGLSLRTEIVAPPPLNLVRKQDRMVAYFDWERLEGPFELRGWERGDRIQPLGLEGRKKLQDLFVDLHIPRPQRGMVPLLTCPKGIFWVIGYRIAEPFKLKEGTRKALKAVAKWRELSY